MNTGMHRAAPLLPLNGEAGPAAKMKRAICERLTSRLREARFETDRLFALLRGDAIWERPVASRHRLIFYLGHLEAFDWNLLCREGLSLNSFEPHLDDLFTFGLPKNAAGVFTDTASDWPAVPTVRSYNRRVRSAIDAALEACIFGARVAHPSPGDLGSVEMAIEHRLMHAEMLSALIHQLPQTVKKTGPVPQPSGEAPASRLVEVPAGTARLGLERTAARFAWENEYDAHLVDVPAFAMASRDVTNADYLGFVEAGGYSEKSLWSADAWSWLKNSRIEHPAFWTKNAGSWNYKAMFGDVSLGRSWPVYVSQAEAEAYARWTGGRLPSEAEFHRAAYGGTSDDERTFPWGNGEPWPSYGVFGFERWDPSPVCSHPAGDTPLGISDLVGNGWKWSSTLMEGFPASKAPTFPSCDVIDLLDGKHYAMKGASPRTATALIRRSFRNGLEPHSQFAYTTFRCVVPRG